MAARDDILKFKSELSDKPPIEILSWAIGHFGSNKVALASSLSIEDQVLTDMLLSIDNKGAIFTIDTLMLPKQTHETISATEERYSFKFEVLSPDKRAVEKMMSEHGPDLFYESIEKRELCCRTRKIEPLGRKLSGLDAWICGLRREQSVTRANTDVIEWDDRNSLIKINPIAGWTEPMVWDYIKSHNVPYSPLYLKGYKSIGCEACTRAISETDDVRSGRWWWESPDHKECGIHRRPGTGDKNTDDKD